MNWFRFKKPDSKPAIPPYTPPMIVPREQAAPEQSAIVVEEVDTSDMTKTGVHRIIRKWKGETPEGG